jgi:HK97 family phage prohead protease
MPTLADFESDGLQVRAASGFTIEDDGEFTGRAVPYGKPADLMPGLREVFLPGAFAAQAKDPGRVKICYRHGEIVGRAVELDDRDDGLWVRGRIMAHDDRPLARQALADLRDDLVDELSVGFLPVRNGMTVTEDKNGTLWEHKRATLREISVVPWGAYGRNARVAAVRAEPDRMRVLLEQINALRVG